MFNAARFEDSQPRGKSSPRSIESWVPEEPNGKRNYAMTRAGMLAAADETAKLDRRSWRPDEQHFS